jgi:predicted HTH transcriptional regulator
LAAAASSNTAPEYPKGAWLEAVVNACVHRSYGSLKNMNIFIRMFDDRLEVESPGGFPPPVTPENIYDMHHPRNPILMDAMNMLNFVKMAREGTRRMRDTMAESELPPPHFAQKDSAYSLVKVTLKNNIKHDTFGLMPMPRTPLVRTWRRRLSHKRCAPSTSLPSTELDTQRRSLNSSTSIG